MKIDSIIFDIDGTLWDSTDPVAIAWNKAIQEHSSLDLVITNDILSKVFGKTMNEIGDILFPTLQEPEKSTLMDLCFTTENHYLEEHPGRIYEGVIETIKALAEHYPLYIVSNCQCGYIEATMKGLGIESYIKDHLCFGRTNLPKGETLKILIEKNHLKAPVYVGDTQGDADACKQAEIPFIFASYGFGNVPDAAFTIERFSDLMKLCASL